MKGDRCDGKRHAIEANGGESGVVQFQSVYVSNVSSSSSKRENERQLLFLFEIYIYPPYMQFDMRAPTMLLSLKRSTRAGVTRPLLLFFDL
jgi:hypothetical protein